jgi:signal transduction histidine kinase
MRRSLSVGVRWALLYTIVTFTLLAVPIGFIYVSVERQIERDASLLLESYLAEVRSELDAHADRPEAAVSAFTARVRRIVPELDYGAAFVRRDGGEGFRVGSLARVPPSRLALLPTHPEPRLARLGDAAPPHLVVTRPLAEGVLQAAISSRSFAGRLEEIKRLIVVGAPLALGLSTLCGAWLARRSLRPIARMNESARRIGGENLSERIPRSGNDDELDRLAATLNGMFDRIAGAMGRLRGFSADAAHQLKSPLASLQNEIEVTLQDRDLDPGTRGLLEGILLQVAELGASVGAMLRLARSESGLCEEQIASVDLPRLLDGVVTLFQPMAEERGIALGLALAEPVEVQGDVAWLRELIANLVQNGISHTPQGGSVSIALEAEPREVQIRVVDTGEGIAPAEQDRVFDRFYRVSPTRDVPGTGLGLALARQIAVAHGGSIELESEPGHGCAFTLRLPRRVEAAAPQRERARRVPLRSHAPAAP